MKIGSLDGKTNPPKSKNYTKKSQFMLLFLHVSGALEQKKLKFLVEIVQYAKIKQICIGLHAGNIDGFF